MDIFVVLVLKELLRNIFGDHYPREIIQLIILKWPKLIISCGNTHTMILDTNQKLYGFGSNYNGQLGTESYLRGNCYQGQIVLSSIVKVKCGSYHTVALTKSGHIYVWGLNSHGQLGSECYKNMICLPHKFAFLSDIKKIYCGNDHMIAITNSNELYAWGNNDYGQLGTGYHKSSNPFPQRVRLENVSTVTCGRVHSVALTNNCERIYVWGSNGAGQLGIGFFKGKSIYTTPTELFLPNVLMVKCGAYHTVALSKSDGILFVWGWNCCGQLGLGDKNTIFVPQELCSLRNIVAVSCGEDHTIALIKSGDIYSWGYNCYGQLGLGNFEAYFVPQKVSLGKIISISCSQNHTMAVTMWGDIWVWGSNQDGQLGLGDSRGRNNPSMLNLNL